MITANQARELSGLTVEEKVESLCKSIETAAKEKSRLIKTGYSHKQDSDLWITGGYKKTEDWKNAKRILEDLGFKVSFYYNEAQQFVDMYTLIEW